MLNIFLNQGTQLSAVSDPVWSRWYHQAKAIANRLFNLSNLALTLFVLFWLQKSNLYLQLKSTRMVLKFLLTFKNTRGGKLHESSGKSVSANFTIYHFILKPYFGRRPKTQGLLLKKQPSRRLLNNSVVLFVKGPWLLSKTTNICETSCQSLN